MGAETRRCKKCGWEGKVTDFPRVRRGSPYRMHVCRPCRTDYQYQKVDARRNREVAKAINWKLPKHD